MRISALCTAVLLYVVVGHPPPVVGRVTLRATGDRAASSPADAIADLFGVPTVFAERADAGAGRRRVTSPHPARGRAHH